jgi:hypothetical protein
MRRCLLLLTLPALIAALCLSAPAQAADEPPTQARDAGRLLKPAETKKKAGKPAEKKPGSRGFRSGEAKGPINMTGVAGQTAPVDAPPAKP